MDLKQRFGLTTDRGTNALAVLLMALEFGRDAVPAGHAEAFTYLIVLAAVLVLWLTRGHEAVLDAAGDDNAETSDHS